MSMPTHGIIATLGIENVNKSADEKDQEPQTMKSKRQIRRLRLDAASVSKHKIRIMHPRFNDYCTMITTTMTKEIMSMHFLLGLETISLPCSSSVSSSSLPSSSYITAFLFIRTLSSSPEHSFDFIVPGLSSFLPSDQPISLIIHVLSTLVHAWSIFFFCA